MDALWHDNVKWDKSLTSLNASFPLYEKLKISTSKWKIIGNGDRSFANA